MIMVMHCSIFKLRIHLAAMEDKLIQMAVIFDEDMDLMVHDL
jgi:hypothetical protein